MRNSRCEAVHTGKFFFDFGTGPYRDRAVEGSIDPAAIPGCRFAHPGYALLAAIMRMRTS
jgi:hypothetical protein